MKTLIIYPNSGSNTVFYLLDPETGEGLASHFCSDKSFAYNDLYGTRPERIKEFKERFGEVKVKFLRYTKYSFEDILKKNKKFSKKSNK